MTGSDFEKEMLAEDQAKAVEAAKRNGTRRLGLIERLFKLVPAATADRVTVEAAQRRAAQFKQSTAAKGSAAAAANDRQRKIAEVAAAEQRRQDAEFRDKVRELGFTLGRAIMLDPDSAVYDFDSVRTSAKDENRTWTVDEAGRATDYLSRRDPQTDTSIVRLREFQIGYQRGTLQGLKELGV